MIDYEIEQSAFVGVAVSNTVVYNIVEHEGEFEYTGLSIIHYLNTDKNMFMGKIFESQSYESIDVILDDQIKFNDYYDEDNSNTDSYNTVYNLMKSDRNIGYYYVYDMLKDMLIVKTPDIDEPIALDYRNSADVREFLMDK